jgi:hypothetical protein
MRRYLKRSSLDEEIAMHLGASGLCFTQAESDAPVVEVIRNIGITSSVPTTNLRFSNLELFVPILSIGWSKS